MSNQNEKDKAAEKKVTDELENQANHDPNSQEAEDAKQRRVPAEKELTVDKKD